MVSTGREDDWKESMGPNPRYLSSTLFPFYLGVS